MKKRIFYLLLIACCLGTYSSAKQIYKSTSIKCGECKEIGKKVAKSKKVMPATIRPFNFYLINI